MMGIFFIRAGLLCRLAVVSAENVKDEFSESSRRRPRRFKVGTSGQDEMMGPQVSCEQLDRIQELCGYARDEGATVLSVAKRRSLKVILQRLLLQPDHLQRINNQMRRGAGRDLRTGRIGVTFKDETICSPGDDTILRFVRRIWTVTIVRAHRFAKSD